MKKLSKNWAEYLENWIKMMKKTFFKIIAITLLLSTISILSGSCAGVWMGNKTDIKLSFNTASSGDKDPAVIDDCKDYKISDTRTQILSFVSNEQPMQHTDNLMPCCEDDNNANNSLSANKNLNFSDLFLADLKDITEPTFSSVNKFSLPVLPILAPPEQLALSTINIRI